MYKIRPSNEVHKKLLLGAICLIGCICLCKLEFIVLFCVRVESLDTLERTNAFLPLTDCTFLANKNCDSQTVKKLNSVAVGGHAPTATPTGKFYGKLCARNEVTSARFAVKFCRRAAEPSAACGGYSEAEQGQRSQSASALVRAPRDADTATRGFQREK